MDNHVLRRRKASSTSLNVVNVVDAPGADDPLPPADKSHVVWGKTPSGQVFRVPTTHDVLTLFHPAYKKSHLDILSLSLLALQIALFAALPSQTARPFFLAYFAFWRIAYDLGLGYLLTKQSKRKWIVRQMHSLGWLDPNRNPGMRAWIRKQLAGKMGKDYSFDELPLEYNTWLLFRQVVDIILLNDFVAYCLFALSCFRVPEGLSTPIHVLRWLGGLILITFNIWVKTEAHHVVKDYGWYWGDVFFQRGALVFDGVFELAPHPMYSVGYAGYYGLSLIVGSYPVLFVSIAAHAAQFGFLVFFENPHIERTYGKKKILASRLPSSETVESILQNPKRKSSSRALPSTHAPSSAHGHGRNVSTSSVMTDISTPSATEGDTATETEVETETELDTTMAMTPRVASPVSMKSTADSMESRGSKTKKSAMALSQHDLFNRYFRKDVLLLHNIDLLRAPDFLMCLTVFYALLFTLLPPLTHTQTLILHFTHALLWRCHHTLLLGLLLKKQSQRKYLVRHFLKHYHYSASNLENARGAVGDAFTNWKGVYNASMVMTFGSFFGFAWKTYELPSEWIVGDQLLRHTLGIFLILLHAWAARESYEVLGVFGWFYGDFFIDDYPTTLEYTGIFRFLNNPEILSGATFFGLALITGSKAVLTLAIVSNLLYWWFLRTVENPHMQKVYGDTLRKDAGITKLIKKVAVKNARLLESRAGRHVPKQLGRVAKEVKGSFDKVFRETEEVVEEFLNKSKPKLEEVMQDTKVLLQQSKERLIITRVASDISSFNTTLYNISVGSTSMSKVVSIGAGTGRSGLGSKHRFHLGEPIVVNWRVPKGHSRKDWIGLYRLGANKSSLVTSVASLVWLPVYDEWDGDVYTGPNAREMEGVEGEDGSGVCKRDGNENGNGEGEREFETGQVVFKGDKLPWSVGTYEIRYHHDGMYNVMNLDGPVEIYVDPPATLDFQSIRWYLIHLVTLCLDSDPSLIPLSSQPPGTPQPSSSPSSIGGEGEERERDPDDFRFWEEKQAGRIARAIKEAFGVEYDAEVVLADANVSALTRRVLVSLQL